MMVSDFLSPTDLTRPEEEEQFLQFSLDSKTNSLLPVSQLAEVLAIPVDRIVPIPHINDWVIGVYNWRGEILWMVDLGQLVGLNPLDRQNAFPSSYKAIILRFPLGHSEKRDESQALGIIVSQIAHIKRYESYLIEPPPPSTPTELIPFLRGYFCQANSEALAVFDGKSILAAMPN